MFVHDENPIKVAYQKKYQRRNLFLLPLLVVIIAMFAAATIPQLLFSLVSPTVFKIIIAVEVATYVVVNLIDWRCPQCRYHFGKQWNPKFCGGCGVELHD